MCYTAETQSMIFQNLLSADDFELTQEEKTIVSRGRNAGSSSGGRKRGPKRLYASNDKDKKVANGGPSAYQDSTALEALIGYIYLTDEERCAELIRFLCRELDKMDK
jgi:23S rRNA maturation mini-RNase III